MNNGELTARQLETLRHIHNFSFNKGFPPTISDLRKAMGVSSDQGVIEILKRLEDRGMIEKRVSGQSRTLKLTAEACLRIGVPLPSAGGSELRGGTPAFELNQTQQRILKRLADFDPRLARMYEGGLRVLLDASNPERIPLSAHSIRESTHHLSDMGKELLSKDEAKAAKDLKNNNPRQLEKLFDPLGGVRHFDQTVYDLWNRDFHQFFVRVSHHGQEVSLAEYLEKLTKYEEFLDRYVLPLQTEIYALLDEQLNNGPELADIEELRLLLSRNLESYRYFFSKADSRWLEFVTRHDCLRPGWEAAEYLARIAGDAPEEVMSVIENIKTTSQDWAMRKGFLNAAMKMPPTTASRLVKKIDRERWLIPPLVDWSAHDFEALFVSLINGNQHEGAIQLATLLLQDSDAGQADLKSYHLQEFLKGIARVPVAELSAYITLLVGALAGRVSSKYPNSRNDHSLMWQPAIEDHEQNLDLLEPAAHLVSALRDALGRYVGHLANARHGDISEVLDRLLLNPTAYSIFTRLKLHCYRHHPQLLFSAIERAVIEEFENINVWHEYYHLVRDQFPNLSINCRSRFFDLIDQGPTGDHEDMYMQHWKARKLSAVIEHLSPVERKKYEQLFPIVREIDHPDFLSYTTTAWRGPTSPVSEDDLEAMPIEAVVERLATWTPSTDWFSSSREGLGRALAGVVGKNAAAFSHEAGRFRDPRIAPVYVYHLFAGLGQGLRNKANLDWQSVLALVGAIIERANLGQLPVFSGNGPIEKWETEWNGAFQEMGTLLEAALKCPEAGLPFGNREEVWNIIEFLCEQPEPTPEYEKAYGADNMDPFTLSINTARGRAFHALFAYVFWCDRNLGGKPEHGSRIPRECKQVLESHLSPVREPSLTVRSVYGHFFPWLFGYDSVWSRALIDRLFPAKDLERRYAAWETYLANPVFPKVYVALKDQYERAISEITNFKKTRRYFAHPLERLASHVMIAYAYHAEDDKGATWTKFFRVANAELRGKAVSFAGMMYVTKDATQFKGQPPAVGRLQDFWEWRLKDSKDREELQEFGWWIKASFFDDQWMLERLVETLHKTDGEIVADTLVLEALAALTSNYPRLCGLALLAIVKSRNARRWMLGSDKDVRHILVTLCPKPASENWDLGLRIVDHLTKLGFEEYRDLLNTFEAAPHADLAAEIVKGH